MRTTSFSIIFMILVEIIFVTEVIKTIRQKDSNIRKHNLEIVQANKEYKQKAVTSSHANVIQKHLANN